MNKLKKHWWKGLSIILLVFVVAIGMLQEVPRLPILNETIRVLYFHVPMWFGMIILLTASMVQAIRYLSKGEMKFDHASIEFANAGVAFGLLGIVTGMVWANFTWGSPWSNDPKQNASAIALLIYLAYFVLRGSLEDEQKKARISAVYNILAFSTLIPLLFILPRMTDSLHPGSGGNPGFNAYDLDNRLRPVFYSAVIGWTLVGVWISQLRIRMRNLEEYLNNEL